MAFIGGSITYGAAYTDPPNYAYLTNLWMNTKFNSAIIKDLAVPGTGTKYATERFYTAIGDFVPDIAFIEFAVNDWSQDSRYLNTYTNLLIDQFREVNSKVVIIYVATTLAEDKDKRLAGEVPVTVATLKTICANRGVHFIDAGDTIWKQVIANKTDFTTYVPDNLHPNGEGIRLYYETVRDDLDKYFPTLNYVG